jgi:hypothetical protein
MRICNIKNIRERKMRRYIVLVSVVLISFISVNCDFVEDPGEVSDPDPEVFTKDIEGDKAS